MAKVKVADWVDYIVKTDSKDYLKAHRDWVEKNRWGYGDRALHYMWYKLLKELPDEARLMEIGVYKGQVISLWGLIGKKLHKKFDIFGLAPLNQETTDGYGSHPAVSQKDIDRILDEFETKATISDGFSTDEKIKPIKDLDLLFIDGGHDEKTVRNDIERFAGEVKVGGYLVFDDAGCNLGDFGNWFKGLPDVSRVVDEFAQTDERFEEDSRCGYVRIFRRER